MWEEMSRGEGRAEGERSASGRAGIGWIPRGRLEKRGRGRQMGRRGKRTRRGRNERVRTGKRKGKRVRTGCL